MFKYLYIFDQFLHFFSIFKSVKSEKNETNGSDKKRETCMSYVYGQNIERETERDVIRAKEADQKKNTEKNTKIEEKIHTYLVR